MTETNEISELHHIHINDEPDSIEIGTPSKGGCIKIYGNYKDVEKFKKKIDNAIEVRKHTNNRIAEVN